MKLFLFIKKIPNRIFIQIHEMADMFTLFLYNKFYIYLHMIEPVGSGIFRIFLRESFME